MKLKQIKEIISDNITQEIASKLCSIICLQKNYLDLEKWTFHVKDCISRSTGSSNTKDGIEISISKRDATPAQRWKVRIWSSGYAVAHKITETGVAISAYTGDKDTAPYTNYQSITKWVTEVPYSAIDLVQLLLEEGFYTVE